MCGISGELRFDGRRADAAAVATMCDAMESRGPDGSGIWSNGQVALGHRRLAIIDLSERGAQPMVDPRLGLTVVFNGCIYNHRQLRAELETHGYQFFSSSDTEVLLAGYHHWGDGFVEHLKGMFAFCIVERDSGRVLLGRDRLGIKPLYLAEGPGYLRFASSLPALVAAGGVDCSIDPVGLHHYLSLHAIVPPPRTILRGVSKLAPATTLAIGADGSRSERTYWSALQGRGDHEARSDDEWLESVDRALRVAVERRLVADVPVGVLLSGGVDSSLIVALLADAGQRGLATFSIGFESAGGEEGDEFKYSDLVAERYDTDHHKMRIPTPDILGTIPGAVRAMSEPMVSHDVVAFYLLSEYVSQHVKVVQSGQGADEVFAGYHWYQTLAASGGDGVDDYLGVFFDRTDAEIDAVVSEIMTSAGNPSRDFVVDRFRSSGLRAAVDQALLIDTTVMLVDDPVKRVDNTTMAWGLEARVPFLDHDLVELAFALPRHLLLSQDGKGVLKDLARRMLPHEIVDRPKGYFPVPPLVHLEGPYVDLLGDALTSPAARDRGLFRPDHVESLLAEPNGLTNLRYNKLWELGLLELWLQTHGIG